MKAVIGTQGQIGDIILSSVAARSFRKIYPEFDIFASINKKYHEVAPLLYNHEDIDGVQIWDGYDDWPNKIDQEIAKNSRIEHYFNPMPYLQAGWQTRIHQTAKICEVYGLPIPEDLSIKLTKWFDVPDYKEFIAVVHTGETDSHKKSLSKQKTRKVMDIVRSLEFVPLVFQKEFDAAKVVNTTFFEAVRVLNGCRGLITIDSAMSWAASGYSIPTLGLYNSHYYKDAGATTSKNWQPFNKNALYLEANGVNNIEDDKIYEAAKEIFK